MSQISLSKRLAGIKYGRFRYNSPWTQVALMGWVCFCAVGMFSALGGLGAGGLTDVQVADRASGILSGFFAVSGFFAGSVNNILGPRLTLTLGTLGYSLYVGGLWSYQLHQNEWFLDLAGALLGISAALLWSAQGQVMMSYPAEKDKGRSFSIFWMIFQLGTVIGSCITLGITAGSTAFTVSTKVYLAFLIVMLLATPSAWLILPAHYVVRGDGTLVELQDFLSPGKEFREWLRLFKDWRVVALFPMFFASNYCKFLDVYTYQGAIEVVLFDARTRALAALLTGVGSMIGAALIGLVLDKLPYRRRTRSMIGAVFVFCFLILVWGGGLGYQKRFSRTNLMTPKDWSQSDAAPPILLLFAYYVGDATFQGLAYYTMSAMTNDPFRLARLAGYYKGVQSAGGAVASAMDAVKTPYMTELLISWIMMLGSLFLAGVVLWHCPESNYDAEAVLHVEDVDGEKLDGAVIPAGHHAHQVEVEMETTDEKEQVHVSVA